MVILMASNEFTKIQRIRYVRSNHAILIVEVNSRQIKGSLTFILKINNLVYA
jgi:hypothetical protein